MNLIKKTVVLSGKCDGYLSVIRVGDDVGVKVVGENFSSAQVAGVKLSDRILTFSLTGNRTEREYRDVDYRENDPIGCIVVENGAVVSRGGAAIRLSEVNESSVEPKVERTEEIVEEVYEETDPTTEEVEDEKTSEEELFSRLSTDGAYYAGIREKLDELFVIHPEEKVLTQAIPDSEWVKIKYDGEDYYVVGRIREEGKVVLIGYGVPGKKAVAPPKIAEGIAHFLELDGMAFDGYWLLFQDAKTGKTVRENKKA